MLTAFCGCPDRSGRIDSSRFRSASDRRRVLSRFRTALAEDVLTTDRPAIGGTHLLDVDEERVVVEPDRFSAWPDFCNTPEVPCRDVDDHDVAPVRADDPAPVG
jgi:hypothetical protein